MSASAEVRRSPGRGAGTRKSGSRGIVVEVGRDPPRLERPAEEQCRGRRRDEQDRPDDQPDRDTSPRWRSPSHAAHFRSSCSPDAVVWGQEPGEPMWAVSLAEVCTCDLAAEVRHDTAGPLRADDHRAAHAPQSLHQGGDLRGDGAGQPGERSAGRLPPGDGGGRHRHDDGGVPRGVTRRPGRTGRDHRAARGGAGAAPAGRRGPRRRRRDLGADRPRRTGGGGHGAPGPRAVASVQPDRHEIHQGGHRRRHRPDHRRLRTRRRAAPGSRVRRGRGAPRAQLPAERVPQPGAEQAHRPVGRQHRAPRRVPAPDRARGSCRGGRFHGRAGEAQHDRRVPRRHLAQREHRRRRACSSTTARSMPSSSPGAAR